MRVRIHRGTREIGGTCVELAHDGARLLVDLGIPLDGTPDDATCHPPVKGLDGSGDLLALILSHGHRDYVRLSHLAGPHLPVALGAATLRILQAAATFIPASWVPPNTVTFGHGQSLTFGPFTITPILVDHSAFDAYALLVEAGGQRLLYSGDLRAHGRRVPSSSVWSAARRAPSTPSSWKDRALAASTQSSFSRQRARSRTASSRGSAR